MENENQNNKNRVMDVNVSVQRSEEISQLYEELAKVKSEKENIKFEKEDIESKFAIVAEKEFKAKAEKLGLKGLDPSNPNDIEKLKDAEQSRASTAYLSREQLGLTNENNDLSRQQTSELEADSTYELINELEKRSNSNDVEAKKLLHQIINKKSGSWEMEFDGDPKNLFRTSKDPKQRELINKDRAKWSRVK